MMSSFIRIFTLLIICLIISSTPVTAEQEQVFRARVTDSDNNAYTLKNITLSGQSYFHCRLKDTLFFLGFEKIRSLTVVANLEGPFKGYMGADLVLTTGALSRIFIDLENYWLEGIEENYNIKIKLPLTAVQRLEFIPEEKKPAPTARPTPAPSPTPTPTRSPAAY